MSGERRLPAEWEAQSGVMLTWPHRESDWAPRLSEIEPLYVHLTALISRYERVLLVCYDLAHREHISTLLQQANIEPGKIVFAVQASNDSWARDHGPITIVNAGQLQLLDFQFNGWGNKYPHDLDNQISSSLHQQQVFGACAFETQDFILEGGSIESDGAGTLLTSRDCLLNPNRNGELNQSQIEDYLQKALGIKHILWLTNGWLAGDDTDSHIDMLARLCNGTIIAYSSCEDKNDEHYAKLRQMHQELETFTRPDGKAYKLVALPIPRAIHDDDGQRLPASYANFLIINGAVLVPQYDDGMDNVAIQRLQDCFPEREIHGLDCRSLIKQYGSLHCISMQLPKGVLD